jgi:ABC-type nickel/cobalt efflux system permease component RcnA
MVELESPWDATTLLLIALGVVTGLFLWGFSFTAGTFIVLVVAVVVAVYFGGRRLYRYLDGRRRRRWGGGGE